MTTDTKRQRVNTLRGVLSNLSNGKSTREAALRELRPLERELGLPESYVNGYSRGHIAEATNA